jgi:guanylate kinase
MTSLLQAVMRQRPSVGFSGSCTTRKPRPRATQEWARLTISSSAPSSKAESRRLNSSSTPTSSAISTARAAASWTRPSAEGRDLILEIDWQGAKQVRARLPEAVQIFILPPSRAELEARLRRRGSDSEDAIARRLQESSDEMSHWRDFDYVIVNRDVRCGARGARGHPLTATARRAAGTARNSKRWPGNSWGP